MPLPNPWWIPRPLLGRLPPLESSHLRLLGFISLALLFENYDFQILNAALPYIAADLGIPQGSLGAFTGMIRLGGAVGIAIIPLADWIGRRRLFLLSLIGFSVGTLATGFSRTSEEFIAFQLISRMFMASGAAATYVMVSEELPAAHRGWGVGILGAVGSLGHALAALLFATIEHLPFGWRALYSFGIAPLLLLPLLRRNLSETRRFEAMQALTAQNRPTGTPQALRSWLKPLGRLAAAYPGRAIGITLLGLFVNAGHMAVFPFISLFVIQQHGWKAWQYSLMFVVCGAIGIVGNVVAGRMGDRIGRRIVGGSFIGVFPFFAWLLYHGPGWSIPLAWIVLVFSVMGANVTSRALTTELFPTSFRGTATGWLFLMEAMGGALGGGLVSAFTPGTDFSTFAATTVSFIALAGAAVLVFFPETHRRELEAISPE